MSLKEVKTKLAEKYDRLSKVAKSKKMQVKHRNRAAGYRSEIKTIEHCEAACAKGK